MLSFMLYFSAPLLIFYSNFFSEFIWYLIYHMVFDVRSSEMNIGLPSGVTPLHWRRRTPAVELFKRRLQLHRG